MAKSGKAADCKSASSRGTGPNAAEVLRCRIDMTYDDAKALDSVLAEWHAQFPAQSPRFSGGLPLAWEYTEYLPALLQYARLCFPTDENQRPVWEHINRLHAAYGVFRLYYGPEAPVEPLPASTRQLLATQPDYVDNFGNPRVIAAVATGDHALLNTVLAEIPSTPTKVRAEVLDAAGKFGDTALAHAAILHLVHRDALACLIQAGCDPRRVCAFGGTFKHWLACSHLAAGLTPTDLSLDPNSFGCTPAQIIQRSRSK
jgi:hypothetical protein